MLIKELRKDSERKRLVFELDGAGQEQGPRHLDREAGEDL